MGDASISLKIFLLIFLGLFSYNCWYFDMVFLFVLTSIML